MYRCNILLDACANKTRNHFRDKFLRRGLCQAFAFDANVATVPRAGTAAQSSVAAIRAELAVLTTETAAKLQLERDKGKIVKSFVRICIIIIHKHEGDAIEAHKNGK